MQRNRNNIRATKRHSHFHRPKKAYCNSHLVDNPKLGVIHMLINKHSKPIKLSTNEIEFRSFSFIKPNLQKQKIRAQVVIKTKIHNKTTG